MSNVSDNFAMTSHSTITGLKYTTKTLADIIPFGSSVEYVKAFLNKYAISKLYYKFPFDFVCGTSVTDSRGSAYNRYGSIFDDVYLIPIYNTVSHNNNSQNAIDSNNSMFFEIINSDKLYNTYPTTSKMYNWHLVDYDINRFSAVTKYAYGITDDDNHTIRQYRCGATETYNDVVGQMETRRVIPFIEAINFYFLNNSRQWIELSNFGFVAISLKTQFNHNSVFTPVDELKPNNTCITAREIFFSNQSTDSQYYYDKMIPMAIIPNDSTNATFNPYSIVSPVTTSSYGFHAKNINPYVYNTSQIRDIVKVEYPDINQYKQGLTSSLFYNSTYLSNLFDYLQFGTLFSRTHNIYFDRNKFVELKKYLPIPFVNNVANLVTGSIDDRINNGFWEYPFITDNGTTNSITGADIKLLHYMVDNPDGDITFGGGHNNFNVTNEDYSNYDDVTVDNIPNLSTIGVFTTTYALSQTTLNQFANYIWNTDEATFNELVENLKMFNNPMDAIINIRLFPFDVVTNRQGVATADTNILLGRVDTGIQGRRLLPNWYAEIDMGELEFYGKDDFTAYEPYTHATLVLPYIASVELPCNFFVNKKVSIKYIVDITTGACSAKIYSNGTLIMEKDGVCGIEIPISAIDRQDYVFNKSNNTMSTVEKIGNTIGKALTGDLGGAISSGFGAITNSIKGEEIKADITKSSASTPTCNLWKPQNCYLIIERTQLEIPSTYGHNVGYVCNKSFKLSELNGYTTCINPHLDDVVCTEYERNLLNNLLISGIIL